MITLPKPFISLAKNQKLTRLVTVNDRRIREVIQKNGLFYSRYYLSANGDKSTSICINKYLTPLEVINHLVNTKNEK